MRTQHGVNMILVVGGIKGGAGKTTLATNLAVILSATGKKVLLVDADEQKSASEWVEQRTGMGFETNWTTISLAGRTSADQIMSLKKDYDHVIVDVGGRDTTSQRSALSIANIFLIPFKPRSYDIWTLGHVNLMLGEVLQINAKLRSIAVINQADSRGSDNEAAREALKKSEHIECFPGFIGDRKAFPNASADGLGVTEGKNSYVSKKEIMELFNYIYGKKVN